MHADETSYIIFREQFPCNTVYITSSTGKTKGKGGEEVGEELYTYLTTFSDSKKR